MRDKWRPKPPPPPSRVGALGFIFVLLLCAMLAVLIFVLDPLRPAARLGDLLGTPEAAPSVAPARPSPQPVVSPQPWQIFLPVILS